MTNTDKNNSGDWNSGHRNSGDRNSGIFCTIEPNCFSFNKLTNKKFSEIDHPDFSNYQLTKWIPSAEMTVEEKKKFPNYGNLEGCLRIYTYKEMWANGWAKDSEENKQKFMNLPNFDADIFLEITGIDVRKKEVSCDGKEVVFNGKTYILTEKK